MSTVTEVPLTPSKNQKFSISMNGVTYNLTLKWNDQIMGGWVMDIADVVGAPILYGVPLVTGADLLAQYGYLAIGGRLVVMSDANADDVPTFANLGKGSHLYYESPN